MFFLNGCSRFKDDLFVIGLRVSATCSSTAKANQLALQLASEVSENDTTDIIGKTDNDKVFND